MCGDGDGKKVANKTISLSYQNQNNVVFSICERKNSSSLLMKTWKHISLWY